MLKVFVHQLISGSTGNYLPNIFTDSAIEGIDQDKILSFHLKCEDCKLVCIPLGFGMFVKFWVFKKIYLLMFYRLDK